MYSKNLPENPAPIMTFENIGCLVKIKLLFLVV